jgi:hypothetical protein
MIRLNVRKDGKVEVKSFIKKEDLVNYIDELNSPVTEFILKYNQTEANKIWDLNVGTAHNFLGYTIAMAGKSRAGNVMYGGQ